MIVMLHAFGIFVSDLLKSRHLSLLKSLSGLGIGLAIPPDDF
jgi:hypothetical protein